MGPLDLWSQEFYHIQDLLGNQTSFKKQFLLPIEKQGTKIKSDQLKCDDKLLFLKKLKSQVANGPSGEDNQCQVF